MADNTLGARIAELRKKKGITQDQLAEYMGISSQAVSKWENDLSCPDISSVPQLADYFHITIDELLRGFDNTEVRVLAQDERKDLSKILLKIFIKSHRDDTLKLNLPLSLIKVGLDIGMKMPEVSSSDALKDIDFAAILSAAENGVVGKLLELESANGDIVNIFIE